MVVNNSANSQLLLKVRLQDNAKFSNFFPGVNQQLVTTLQSKEQFVYFWGNSGSGKSHLLQACCSAAHELGQSSTYLPLKALTEFSIELFDDLETLDLVCIDDIDAIAGISEWEEALLHFYNRLRNTPARLMMAGKVAPHLLGLKLLDLSSRLAGSVVFHLYELSEVEKQQVLQQRANARGWTLTSEVAEFLLRRCPRDMSALCEIIDKLDQETLLAKRKLTIPFVKSVLGL